MALSKLSGDEQGILFTQLCNALEPGVAVALSSVSNELRTATLALQQQLRADHEAAARMCRKVGLWSCKELREAKKVEWCHLSLTAAELTLLGKLGSMLPALEKLSLREYHDRWHVTSAPLNGVQGLAAGLGAGALPAVTYLSIFGMHMGDAGASALAAALGQGALPRVRYLFLGMASIGDAGLVVLAPALRRLPALEYLCLQDNPFGDEGLDALVAPPPPAGAPPTATGVLTKLNVLILRSTKVTDAGCTALAAVLNSGAMPALEYLDLNFTPLSYDAKAVVYDARANLTGLDDSDQESGESGSESEYAPHVQVSAPEEVW